MEEALRCAIVGYGRFGQFLSRLIQNRVPALRLTAAVALPLDHPQNVRKSLEADIPIYRSLADLLDEDEHRIDAVLLCSANYQHCEQTIAAARAGKHVFCEKPMAITVNDCVAMVQAAKEAGIKLMVGHKRRLRMPWRKLTDIAQSGEIGQIVAVNINGWHHHSDIPLWWLEPQLSGGLLHRAGCHDIDYLHALLGPAHWVSAVQAPAVRPDAKYPETLWLTLGFAGESVAGLQISLWFEPTPFRESFAVQVLGTKGSALLKRHDGQPQELILTKQGFTPERMLYEDDGSEAYCLELNSFARWTRDSVDPVLTWYEGLQCVRTMEAAYCSVAREGARVAIDEVRV